MELNITNQTRFKSLDYIADNLQRFCSEAHIAPSAVHLIIKRRNRYVGDCWIKKGNRDIPSGLYKMDFKTIIVRIGKHSHKDDLLYVLAHEIGHLKQHLEAGKLETAGDWRIKYSKPESYASKFAIQQCRCYPKSNYRIKRYTK